MQGKFFRFNSNSRRDNSWFCACILKCFEYVYRRKCQTFREKIQLPEGSERAGLRKKSTGKKEWTIRKEWILINKKDKWERTHESGKGERTTEKDALTNNIE